VALYGPEGAGKEVLARWMHFEGSRLGAPLRVHRSGTRVALELIEADGAGGTWILDDFDRSVTRFRKVIPHDYKRALAEPPVEEPSAAVVKDTGTPART